MRLIIVALTLVSFSAEAQKIKYKDLFVLLNAGRYEEAEPFLKKFIEQDEKIKEPNAFLHMGNIYREKAQKTDVLTNSEDVVAYADSAIIFYNKAITYIDEKEIRNDEYYEAYLRRDLRTGKVEISLSDIHFDLQKRVQALEDRKGLASDLREKYIVFTTLYDRAAIKFNDLRSRYPEIHKLYLRSDDDAIAAITNIKASYDSARLDYLEYRSLLDGSAADFGYNQIWEEKYLEGYQNAKLEVDFLQDDIETYNLSKWAGNTKGIILNEIKPLKTHILEYDVALDNLDKKVKSDSLSVKSEITSLTERLLSQQLEKYDDNPFPIQIFKYKLAELEYLSSKLEYQIVLDSGDMFKKLEVASDLLVQTEVLDSLLLNLMKSDVEEENRNYPEFFVERYNSAEGVKNYLEEKVTYVREERSRISDMKVFLDSRITYMIHGSDTIPIQIDTSNFAYSFKPLKVEDETYSIGLIMPEKRLKGVYFTDINPSRESKIKIDIPIDTTEFSYHNLNKTEALAASDKAEKIYYVVVTQPHQKDASLIDYTTLIGKIYRENGLAWAKTFSLENKPTSIFYEPDTGDLVLSFAEIAQRVVITKEGELKKK